MSDIKYCPHCGTVVESDSAFCGKCGGNVNVSENPPPIQPTTQPQFVPQTQQPTQMMYSAPLTPKSQSKATPLGIIGLIVGIITFLGLSWASWLTRIDRFYIIIIYFVIGIAGVVISGIAIKESKVLGIVGLILGILGTFSIGIALLLGILFYALMI